MEKTRARILVVEDDPAIRRGLLDVFVFNGFAASGAGDGDQGLAMALGGEWDLMVLDVMLPGRDGVDICREVRRAKPAQAVILLTAKGAEQDILSGFRAGADDYVTKPFSLAELMVRVEAVLRRAGKGPARERIALCGLVFDGEALTLESRDGQAPLTRREMDIMSYLAARPGRIVTKRDLLENVWQYHDPDVETRTVEIHIQKLRKKILSLAPETPLITTVRGEGFRLEAGP